MESNDTNCKDFYSIITSSSKSFTAFNLLKDSGNCNNFKDFNLFGFPEDNYEFELKCPICLGRVSSASRPENCLHVFCRLCLKEWKKQSTKCPYCRIPFKNIIKVSYSEPWIYEKYS